MIDYSVKNNNGVYTLLVNQVTAICPFVLSLPVSDNLGRLTPTQTPCTSRCPSFEILKKDGVEKPSVHLHCCKRTFESLEEKK